MNDIVTGFSFLISIVSLSYMAWRFLTARRFYHSLFTILILGLILRIIGASDPYLHEWDERYHALVAKNLIQAPLQPTLHKHVVLKSNPDNWVGSNIWLAKPSFPLWIMAGSISIFGDTLFAIRLPSVLLGLLAIWLTFLIGRRLFDERIGLLAAFFHAINGLIIELVGGRVSSDHVETCFIVMVQLAVYLAIIKMGSRKSLLFIFYAGLVMGLAFLSKWYPALVVLPIWAVVFIKQKLFNWSSFIRHLVLLGIGFSIVALPWTIYMLNEYPLEMKNILFNALSAYQQTVENHAQPFYYYFHKVLVVYGELIYISIFFFIYKGFKWKQNGEKFGVLIWALLPVVIFSFASTKRFTYLLISAPAFFLISSWFWFFVKEQYSNANLKWVKVLTLILLLALPIRYMVERTKFFGNDEELTGFYQYLPNELAMLNERTIIFGADDYVEIMFHTDVYAAYRRIPPEEKIKKLKAEGFIILFEKENRLMRYD